MHNDEWFFIAIKSTDHYAFDGCWKMVGNLERMLALLHLEAIHSRLCLYRDTKHM